MNLEETKNERHAMPLTLVRQPLIARLATLKPGNGFLTQLDGRTIKRLDCTGAAAIARARELTPLSSLFSGVRATKVDLSVLKPTVHTETPFPISACSADKGNFQNARFPQPLFSSSSRQSSGFSLNHGGDFRKRH
jgi:hypothetical protein